MTRLRELAERGTRAEIVALELAMALVGMGFVFLGFTWSSVAALLTVPLQLPFIVSGGFGGIALIGLGLAVLAIQTNRFDRARDRDDIDELIEAAARLLPADDSKRR
jgi:hypothetical protein